MRGTRFLACLLAAQSGSPLAAASGPISGPMVVSDAWPEASGLAVWANDVLRIEGKSKASDRDKAIALFAWTRLFVVSVKSGTEPSEGPYGEEARLEPDVNRSMFVHGGGDCDYQARALEAVWCAYKKVRDSALVEAPIRVEYRWTAAQGPGVHRQTLKKRDFASNVAAYRLSAPALIRNESVAFAYGGDDEDGNGLADGWERHFFGATGQDAGADPDGDGRSNAQAFAMGVAPLSRPAPAQAASQTSSRGSGGCGAASGGPAGWSSVAAASALGAIARMRCRGALWGLRRSSASSSARRRCASPERAEGWPPGAPASGSRSG